MAAAAVVWLGHEVATLGLRRRRRGASVLPPSCPYVVLVPPSLEGAFSPTGQSYASLASLLIPAHSSARCLPCCLCRPRTCPTPPARPPTRRGRLPQSPRTTLSSSVFWLLIRDGDLAVPILYCSFAVSQFHQRRHRLIV